ncbi:hypothetical protein GW17_00036969, partial [Ensete ventricosum]
LRANEKYQRVIFFGRRSKASFRVGGVRRGFLHRSLAGFDMRAAAVSTPCPSSALFHHHLPPRCSIDPSSRTLLSIRFATLRFFFQAIVQDRHGGKTRGLSSLDRSRIVSERIRKRRSNNQIFASIAGSFSAMQHGRPCCWMDTRDVLIVNPTSSNQVDPDYIESEKRLKKWLLKKPADIIIATGFIASTLQNIPTTLKRDGSDFSAAILSALLKARQVTIWTDVDGVFSADPSKGLIFILDMLEETLISTDHYTYLAYA